jgi:PAS domain S-box-containing protein
MRIGPKLILGFAGIGGVIALTAVIGVIPVKNEMAKLEEFHTPAMYLIQSISTNSLAAIEEGFAYVASGEKREKEEFFAWAEKFDLQAEEFRKIAFLNDPVEIEERVLFERILANQQALVKKAEYMFNEFEAKGSISHIIYIEYNNEVDRLMPDLEKFVSIEREEVTKAQQEATGIIKRSQKLIIAIGILAVILAIAISYFLSRTISNPIAKLRDATDAIAKGDLGKRAEVGSGGEIGELAVSFNRMADEIQVRNEELLTINELRIKDIAIASSINGIAISDLAGKIQYVNDSFLNLWGYDNKQDVIGKSVFMFLDNPALAQIAAEAIRKSGHWSGEINGKKKGGAVITVQFAGNVILDSAAKPSGMLSSFLDLSERMRAEEEITRQLAEKGILLKEVHHRIKNNIASIGGLISLRLQSITNPEAIAVLQDAIGRVDSMRILYDKLLLSEGYKDISVKNYIESLADTLMALFPESAKVTIGKRIADFQLNAKQLFPIGIIINELITNTMKYAFIDREAGTMNVSLAIKNSHITLTVQDNGCGLPDGFDIEKSQGFGLKLVTMLSKQLGGSFIMETHAGTQCKVEFDI